MINTVREVCKFLSTNLRHSPACIETGTMYCCPEGNEEHVTTYNILVSYNWGKDYFLTIIENKSAYPYITTFKKEPFKSFALKKEHLDKDLDPNMVGEKPGDFFEGDLDGEEFKNVMKQIQSWDVKSFKGNDTSDLVPNA